MLPFIIYGIMLYSIFRVLSLLKSIDNSLKVFLKGEHQNEKDIINDNDI